MHLLGDDLLEQSGIVANCRMNRERSLTGSNGYAQELGFNPLDWLRQRVELTGRATWLDLCCGSATALFEASRIILDEELASKIQLVGVDLVGMFCRVPADGDPLQLIEASLSTWEPERDYDLITCVHGLHYIGNKLGLITRAAGWLTDQGLFVATLDLSNIKFVNGRSAGRSALAQLRRNSLRSRDKTGCQPLHFHKSRAVAEVLSQAVSYDSRKHLISCHGRQKVELTLEYVGADDRAGPNFTGQPAVNSYYR